MAAARLKLPCGETALAFHLLPYAAPLFVPFALLPDTAFVIWVALSVAMLAAATWLSVRALGWRVGDAALGTALALRICPA